MTTIDIARENLRHNETQLRHWQDQLRHARDEGKARAAAFWVDYYTEQVARSKRTVAQQDRAPYGR